MRIIIDPISEEPAHALSRRDIKAIMNVVPDDWLRFIKTIHLASMRPEHTRFDRPVIYSGYSGRLNVASRGLAPRQARKEVLRELAKEGLRVVPSKANSLSAHQLREIDHVIAPLLDQLEADADNHQPEQ